MLDQENRKGKKQISRAGNKEINGKNKQRALDEELAFEREAEFRQIMHKNNEEGIRKVFTDSKKIDEGIEKKIIKSHKRHNCPGKPTVLHGV